MTETSEKAPRLFTETTDWANLAHTAITMLQRVLHDPEADDLARVQAAGVVIEAMVQGAAVTALQTQLQAQLQELQEQQVSVLAMLERQARPVS